MRIGRWVASIGHSVAVKLDASRPGKSIVRRKEIRLLDGRRAIDRVRWSKLRAAPHRAVLNASFAAAACTFYEPTE
jgi:hypothetical protein